MSDKEVHIYHASAGTGKTSTLLNILDTYLQNGTSIDNVAFVTFTKKGAEVAKLRTAERFGIPLNKLNNFRTIHSMAFRGCAASRDRMMDYPKYKDFGEQAGYEFGKLGLDLAEGTNWYEMKDQRLVTVEQLYRNNRPYCEKIMDSANIEFSDLARYMTLYRKYKNTYGYYDFTDLLENYIQQGYTENVDVVFLDEMQDSTLLQWQMVFRAFKNASHIYIAGDDKQAVFQYAGGSHDTLLKLRGEQHSLDISYRVPSVILNFAQGIADEIQDSYHYKCKAAKEGGIVKELTCLGEIANVFDINKSYFFLARNKKFFGLYEEWCRAHALPYKIKGTPIFTATDKLEFREGRTSEWSIEKLTFAQDCVRAGTFYMEPNINISTIHTVKGDEADVVVLMSDISKAVHSQLDIDEDSEHRVFYVAVTRAKEELYIIQPQTRMYYPYLF